jgi:hypothetical protein
MLQPNFRQIGSQVCPLIFTEPSVGEANDGPQVNRVPAAFIMFAQIMNLGVAVMTGGNAVARSGCQYLLFFQAPVFPAGLGKSGLQKSPAAAAAVVVGLVGEHVDKVLFTDNGFHHKPKIVGHGIPETLPDQLAGILNRKFHFEILVPVGVDRKFSFTDPFGIILNDARDFKVVRNVEFFQSGPDCKQFMPSLRV